MNGDRVAYVSVQSLETGHESTLEAPIFLDATETGALTPSHRNGVRHGCGVTS